MSHAFGQDPSDYAQPLVTVGSIEDTPTLDDRASWNAQHNKNLLYHDDELSVADAEKINQYFAIDVCLGAHGLAPDDQDAELERLRHAPTQSEYEEVGRVVDRLRPERDTLLVENYGFDEAEIPSQGPIVASGELSVEVQDNELIQRLARISQDGAIRSLEEARRNYQLSSWDYGIRLATLKGVRVVYADYDQFDTERIERTTGKDYVACVRNNKDPEFTDTVGRGRARAARNIVKDVALQILPDDVPTLSPDEKPRLTLLFGLDHRGDMEQSFAELGLHVNSRELAVSTPDERLKEHMGHLLGVAGLAGVMVGLGVRKVKRYLPQKKT